MLGYIVFNSLSHKKKSSIIVAKGQYTVDLSSFINDLYYSHCRLICDIGTNIK